MRYAGWIVIAAAWGCGGGRSPSMDAATDSAPSADGGSDAAVDAMPPVDGPCPTWLGMRVVRSHPDLHAVAQRADRIVAVGDHGSIIERDAEECLTATGSNWYLRALIATESGFLAGGQFGDLYASTDGRNWERVPIPSQVGHIYGMLPHGDQIVIATDFIGGDIWTRGADGVMTNRIHVADGMRAIASGAGVLVAVGESGTILMSPDAVAWTPVTVSFADDLHDLAYGPAGFIAVAPYAGRTVIARSGDGAAWTTGEIAGHAFRSITHGAGLYVAVGEAGQIRTSPDGVTWTARTSGTSNALMFVEHDGSRFFASGAAGTILESTDAIAWTVVRAGDPAEISAVAEGGVFVATTDRGLLTSSDGTSWTAVTLANAPPLVDVAHGGGRFVAVGGADAPAIVTSTDGTSWQSIAVAGAGRLEAVAHGTAGWIATGAAGLVFTSPDGVAWTSRSASGPTRSDLAFANGRYVALSGATQVQVTTDGTTWTAVTVATPGALRSLGSLGTALVLTDGNRAFVSTDGMQWTQHALATSSTMTHVTSGVSPLFIVGVGGRLNTSADGMTWTEHALLLGNHYRGVARDGSQTVLVGEDGFVAVAPLGATPF